MSSPTNIITIPLVNKKLPRSTYLIVIFILFVVGIGFQYGKSKHTQRITYRIVTDIIIGIACLMSYIFICTTSWKLFKNMPGGTANIYMERFKILVYTGIFGAFCIFPLIIHSKTGEDIYSRENPQVHHYTHDYSGVVNTINVTMNIITVVTFLYSVYLLFSQRAVDNIPKQQLLFIIVIFAICTQQSIKNVIDDNIK